MNGWRVEVLLAGVCAVLAVATAVLPRWIEVVFRVDLDHGDGGLEWTLVVLLGVTAVVAAVRGLRHRRVAVSS